MRNRLKIFVGKGKKHAFGQMEKVHGVGHERVEGAARPVAGQTVPLGRVTVAEFPGARKRLAETPGEKDGVPRAAR